MTTSLAHNIGIDRLSEMQEAVADAFSTTTDDLVLLSPTGSGKTLAYLLPLIDTLTPPNGRPTALVLVPTRELAEQTEQLVHDLHAAVRALALHGGRPVATESRQLHELRPAIIVATPGRLLDHLAADTTLLASAATLVIDEFDKCLEIGFSDQMRTICRALPATARHILLSATDAPSLPSFVRAGHALRLNYLDTRPLSVTVVPTLPERRTDTLFRLLCRLDNAPAIVFFNRREDVERVGQALRQRGLSCAVYHGLLEQEHRQRALVLYAHQSAPTLLATDLAARGLDIPATRAVIHADLPENATAFLHRNGRAMRWQRTGQVYLLAESTDALPDFIDPAQVRTLDIGSAPLPSLPHAPAIATLYIGKGKQHKISRGDIVGFLCQTGKMRPDDIGHIDVLPRCAYVAVPASLLPHLLQRLEGQKIKGIKTLYRQAR